MRDQTSSLPDTHFQSFLFMSYKNLTFPIMIFNSFTTMIPTFGAKSAEN